MYADNITKSCVVKCPTYFYGDMQRGYGMCVNICPSTTVGNYLQFADNYTQTCVIVCPVVKGTWGDKLSLKCVTICPEGWFSQEIPTRYCEQICSLGTWG